MMRRNRFAAVTAASLLLAGSLAPSAAFATPSLASVRKAEPKVVTPADRVLEQIDVMQMIGDSLPLDARFTDEEGRKVELGDYFGEKPVVLVLAYYECPMLCTLVLNGLVKSLRPMKSDVGEDFDVVVIGFDPGETPEMAAAKKATYLEHYDRPETAGGWHYLTGEEDQIRRVTEATGFKYAYDEQRDEYGHAAAVMIATPDGRLSRYLFGVEYSARDMRLALVEASDGKLGTIVDRLLLLCYHYDPARGKYSAVAMNLVRAGGVLTVGALAAFMILTRRRDRRTHGGG